MELPDLAKVLSRLEEKRFNAGSLSSDDAVIRAAIERRVLHMVCSPAELEKRERLRVPCRLEISLASEGRLFPAVATDLGPGGMFVRTDRDLEIGQKVDIHLDTATSEHMLQVPGKVGWRKSHQGEVLGLGITFSDLERESDLRRLWRLIIRLLEGHAN